MMQILFFFVVLCVSWCFLLIVVAISHLIQLFVSPKSSTFHHLIYREQLKKQEEMVARQEEMRRKTAAYEAELRTKTEVAKEKAKAEGRIAQERANHDLILSKVRLEAAEQRDTVLKAIQDSGTLIGNGIAAYLNDTTKLRNTALTITGIAVGIITARTTIGIAGRTIEARLGKPNLIRETSITTVSQWFKQPYEVITKMISKSNKANESDALQGIIMEPSLDVQLRKIALSTSNTKKNRAPFRHLLLHGPPGTGKTLFARNLAQHSGLDYAILTGGDIAPLGRDAVTELHKLFDWAKTSRRGLLLFVDEADAFLQSRATSKLSEDQRNALNAFLFRTGTESDQFMMVYASNQPAQFDEAVLDRIDEMVSFDLPGPNERRKMIAYYIDKYLLNPPSTWTRKVETVDIGDAEIERVVQETEGFSGRAISKLAIAWQAAAYGTENAILDQESFFRTVQQQKESINIKQTWLQQAQSRAKLLTQAA
jgi:ATPase family AAA domain-containing protein 3A/B